MSRSGGEEEREMTKIGGEEEEGAKKRDLRVRNILTTYNLFSYNKINIYGFLLSLLFSLLICSSTSRSVLFAEENVFPPSLS